jgi:hypothetical protein
MKTQHDKFESLAWDSPFSVVVLGNPSTADFALVPLPGRLSEPVRHDYNERGFHFLGVVGIVDGVPRVSLDEPLSAPMTDAIARQFITHFEVALGERIAAMGAEDLSWLKRLCAPNLLEN